MQKNDIRWLEAWNKQSSVGDSDDHNNERCSGDELIGAMGTRRLDWWIWSVRSCSNSSSTYHAPRLSLCMFLSTEIVLGGLEVENHRDLP